MGDREADQSTAFDRQQIRDLIENWAIWRDTGDWERFATVWHEDGRMNATWFQAGAAEFTTRARKGFEAGSMGARTLGGCSIDVRGHRATAQTRMQITQREKAGAVEVDVVCTGAYPAAALPQAAAVNALKEMVSPARIELATR